MSSSRLVGRLRVALGLDDTQFQRGMRGTQASLARVGRQLTVAGAGFSAAGAGIALAIRGQLNAADDLGKLAQKIGIPVDELSRLSHAADMSGVSMGSLQTSVARLSRAMATTPDRFRKIGVAVRDAQGNMRSTSDVLSDVAQVLSEMPDGAEKTALAMEFLGRSGADLIPMLNGGRDALRGMMEEADALGIVITPEMFKNAETFNDNISRLRKQMSGLVIMVTASLAPAIERLSTLAVDLASRFRNLSPQMQSFISTAAVAVMALGPILTGLGLMTLAISPFIKAMMGAAGAVRALSLAFLANPIGLAVAAIAGAAVLIYRNWDQVGPWFARMWDSVKAIFAGFKDFVAGIFTGDLSRALDGLKAIFSGLKDYYQGLWDGIVGVFRFAWENGIKPITDALGMTDAILRGWDRLKAGFDRILGGIGAAFDAAWAKIEPIVTKLTTAWDRVTGMRDGPISSGYDPSTDPGDAGLILPQSGGHLSEGLGQGTVGIRTQGGTDARAYLDDFAAEAEIQSPSRKMIAFGQFIAQGLGLGIANGQPMVDAASTGLGQSLNDRITPYFEGVTRGARNLGDVFDNVKSSFANMLADMASRLAASGLSRILGSVFGGLFGGGDALTGALRGTGLAAIPAYARGTPFSPDGLARVNERGGEILDLPGGTRVIPHDISKRMADMSGGDREMAIAISMDESTGGFRAIARDEAGRIVAEAAPSIIGRSIGAVQRGARKSNKFLGA